MSPERLLILKPKSIMAALLLAPSCGAVGHRNAFKSSSRARWLLRPSCLLRSCVLQLHLLIGPSVCRQQAVLPICAQAKHVRISASYIAVHWRAS